MINRACQRKIEAIHRIGKLNGQYIKVSLSLALSKKQTKTIRQHSIPSHNDNVICSQK